MKKTIICIMNIMPVLSASFLLVSCDGGGDGTVGNWFVAIIVILALLKKG